MYEEHNILLGMNAGEYLLKTKEEEPQYWVAPVLPNDGDCTMYVYPWYEYKRLEEPQKEKYLSDLTDEQFAVIHKIICGPWHDKEIQVSRYNWNVGMFKVNDFFGWITEYDAVRGEITKTANGKDCLIENMDEVNAKLAEWGVKLN